MAAKPFPLRARTLDKAPPIFPVPEETIAIAELLGTPVHTETPAWERILNSSCFRSYRIIPPGSYKDLGYVEHYLIHLWFKRDGHRHVFAVPHQVARAFGGIGSKGKFFRRVLLGPDWNAHNKVCRYPNWPLQDEIK